MAAKPTPILQGRALVIEPSLAETLRSLGLSAKQAEQVASSGLVQLTRPPDTITKVDRYNQGPIECIDALESMLGRRDFIGWLRGTIVKYQWRLGHKAAALNEAEKADYYSRRLVATLRLPEEQDR